MNSKSFHRLRTDFPNFSIIFKIARSVYSECMFIVNVICLQRGTLSQRGTVEVW